MFTTCYETTGSTVSAQRRKFDSKRSRSRMHYLEHDTWAHEGKRRRRTAEKDMAENGKQRAEVAARDKVAWRRINGPILHGVRTQQSYHASERIKRFSRVVSFFSMSRRSRQSER